ncbi:MAG: hypothetical protein JXA01_09875, partial [Dehalococcoidia bacterium]|nr:hypothetical protein [Dehalococcoidia bacterium]
MLGLLWLLWQILTDELVGLIRDCIPEDGVIMFSITHPYIIMPILIIWVSLFLIWRRFKQKTPKSEIKPIITQNSISLVATLTEMHRRLIEIQKETKPRVNTKQLEKVTPVLLDKIELVKLKD